MQSFKPRFSQLAISLLIAVVGATAASAAERGPIQATAVAPERSVASATQLVFSPDENNQFGGAQVSQADRHGRHLFIIRFAEPSIARYEGGIEGFQATSPRATGERLSMRSDAVQAYRGFLESRHSENLAQMERFVQRSIEPTHQFLNALNGVAVRLTPQEAELVAGLPFVAGIEIDRLDELHTDEGPTLIGAPDFWDGMVTSGVGNKGEGVIIGIMDSGFNHGHPSFAEEASDGYIHTNPYGDGVFVGVCADPDAEDYEDVCNNKLIGAYSLAAESVSAEDTAASGHGTHVASTAGGNPLTVSIPFNYLSLDVDISGVAPRANLINYKVCEPLCSAAARIAAVNFAIADGVDVLNHSIGNGEPPWASAVSLAFLDANAAGIVVAASAGNSGPGPSTAASTGPWNLAVGASTHQRRLALFATIGVDPTEYTGSAFGLPLPGPYTGNLRYAGDVDPGNFLGCEAFPADAFDGEAALIRRGGCNFIVKVNNAVAAGANFVVIANNAPGIQGLGGLEAATVSVLSVTQQAGDDFIAAVDGDVEVINVQAIIEVDPNNADTMAGFSSRGPSSYNVIAPAITAPGVQILAASTTANDNFNIIGGTSMSSPHVAGSAALLVAQHPDWTPTEIRSALTLSANPNHRKEDGVTPADPFDMGSGRVDVAAAGNIGFVMDESIANFVAANPANGGAPETLNLSSIKDMACPGSCSYQRTIRSVVDQSVDYLVSADVPAGASITVTPSAFTLAPGQTLTLEIDIDVSGAAFDEYLFAGINITQAQAPVVTGVLETAEYSASTVGGPTWQRTINVGTGASGGCSLSGTGSNVAYHVQDFEVAANGDYDISSVQDYDGFLHVYEGGFAPTDQCRNLIALNDDGGPGSLITALALSDAETYTIVTSGFSNASLGNFTNTITGPGAITLLDQPDPPVIAAARIPVAVIPREPNPSIVVSPAALSSTQQRNEVSEQQFSISNVGQLPLEWSLNELGPQAGNRATFSDVVIWDNPQLNNSGRINNFSIPAGTGIYQSDAFALLAPSSIETIFSPGFVLGEPGVTELAWMVFADNNGVPAGNPESNPEAALWSFQAAVGAPGVSFASSAMSLDLPAAGAPALELDPGIYWLFAYPTVQNYSLGPNNLFAWYHGVSVATGRQIAPGGLSGFPANWVGVPEGRAFTLTGSVDCSAQFNPWTNVSPTSGTVAPDSSESVTVEFYSVGLIEGSYDSAFCIASNDPESPVTLMPVRLNVVNLPSASVSPGDVSLEVEFDGSDSEQVVISNSGLGELTFSVVGGQRGGLRGTLDLIYDQTASQTTNGALAIYDLDPGPWIVQAADDFAVPVGEIWTIDQVVANGFYLGLVNPATSVRVYFYDDAGGTPGDEIASFTDLAPSTDNSGVLTLDLPASVDLSGGTYWVSVQPEMDFFADGRWFWFQNADQVGNEFHWRNPGDGYMSGCTDWGPASACGFVNPDLSFQLLGQVADACEPISNVPWLSVDPSSGTVAAEGGQQPVDLIADGSTVLPGVYSTTVCFETNDGANPLLLVEVTLTVTGDAPDAIFSDRFEGVAED